MSLLSVVYADVAEVVATAEIVAFLAGELIPVRLVSVVDVLVEESFVFGAVAAAEMIGAVVAVEDAVEIM